VEEWQKISFERHGEEQHKRRSILGRLGWGMGSKSKKAWQRAGAKVSGSSAPPKFDASCKTLEKAGAPEEKLADVGAVFAAALDKADSMGA
jgi:hypothetical protein